jgi:hypothetical protein
MPPMLTLLPYGNYTPHLFRTTLVRFYSLTGLLEIASYFICLQHLSNRNVAILHVNLIYNSDTIGYSIKVLAYC